MAAKYSRDLTPQTPESSRPALSSALLPHYSSAVLYTTERVNFEINNLVHDH